MLFGAVQIEVLSGFYTMLVLNPIRTCTFDSMLVYVVTCICLMSTTYEDIATDHVTIF